MVGTKAFPKGCIIKLCTDNTIVIDGNWYLSNDPIIYQNGSLKYAFTTDFMGDAEFIINYNNQNKTATAILRMKYDISQRAKIYLREIKETEVGVKDKDSDNKAQSKLDGYGFESIEMLDTNSTYYKAFNELIQMTNAIEEIQQKLEANPYDEKAVNELSIKLNAWSLSYAALNDKINGEVGQFQFQLVKIMFAISNKHSQVLQRY